MFIVPVKPFYPEEDRKYILDKFQEILEGKGFLSQHKFCQQLEEEFSKYVGTKYAVTTNSGTSALETIFRALEIKDKEVIIPANTFAATAFAVINAGGIPVFADIDETMNLDPSELERRVSERTARSEEHTV